MTADCFVSGKGKMRKKSTRKKNSNGDDDDDDCVHILCICVYKAHQ